MTAAWICMLTLAAAPPGLGDISRTLRTRPAWTASFEQRYVPAGFEDGTVESGEVLLANPNLLRFDYAGESRRVFAFDGSVARMVDTEAATCDAVRLDPSTRAGIPLAVLTAPESRGELFSESHVGATLVLRPRDPDPDLAEIRIDIGDDGLPRRFSVVDEAGNRNDFTFDRWHPVAAPAAPVFQPSLPGQPPCGPPGG